MERRPGRVQGAASNGARRSASVRGVRRVHPTRVAQRDARLVSAALAHTQAAAADSATAATRGLQVRAESVRGHARGSGRGRPAAAQ